MNSRQNLDEMRGLLRNQAELLINAGTGKISIRDTDFDAAYQENDRILEKSLKGLGLSTPFPWRTLWEWHGFYKNRLIDYASRREHVGSLLRKTLDELDEVVLMDVELGTRLGVSKAVVIEALADAEILIRDGRYSTAVDRLHTALHGHLLWICERAEIDVSEDNPSVTRLMKLVRENHPNFTRSAILDKEVRLMFMSFGRILESLNAIRNNASPAHPNDLLLAGSEARLALNVSRTLLHYLDDKTQS